MKYSIRKSNNRKILTFNGALTVHSANKMKIALMKVLVHSDHVVLDLKDVTTVDLTGLQLLCSVHRTAIHLERELTLKVPLPDLLNCIIEDSGFCRHMGCELDHKRNCLWVCRTSGD